MSFAAGGLGIGVNSWAIDPFPSVPERKIPRFHLASYGSGLLSGVGPQQPQDIDQFVADCQQVHLRLGRRNWLFLDRAVLGQAVAQLVAGTADGEALLVERI